ncbi:hypothetical protein QR680_008372 [Steinernema hermaphroditum]|uniref:Insulin-like domain-containing protein n=1 Tax=Steinernema hermaphroditum TaxID=289476 RepID=A0AA39M7I8_9BILA|nr:hypothetical protein QR680_008372 [Steinernema hermaphroditum]
MWLANLAWMALLITSAAYLQQADAQKVEQLFFTLLQESSKTSSDLTEPRRLCDEEFFDTLAIVCDHCVLFGRTKGERAQFERVRLDCCLNGCSLRRIHRLFCCE